MIQHKSEIRFRALGSSCHICVASADGRGEKLLALAKNELLRLESKFSTHQPSSLVSKINSAAGSGNYTPLDKESRSLFEFANALWRESNHQFDPSSEILRDCYCNGLPVKGSAALLKARLAHVGWNKVEFNDNGVRLFNRGMLVDLDGCVRPYAADSIRRILLQHKVSSALVSLDEDIATIGKQHDGANWLVGVKYPKQSGVAIARLKLNYSGYAIRGDFKQSITIDGERYGTALSPVDGQPIPGLLSVGVMAESCLAASGAASVARAKTEQSALNWLRGLGLPWVAIGRDMKSHGLLSAD